MKTATRTGGSGQTRWRSSEASEASLGVPGPYGTTRRVSDSCSAAVAKSQQRDPTKRHIDRIRVQIADGTYETEAKIDALLPALAEELGFVSG